MTGDEEDYTLDQIMEALISWEVKRSSERHDEMGGSIKIPGPALVAQRLSKWFYSYERG